MKAESKIDREEYGDMTGGALPISGVLRGTANLLKLELHLEWFERTPGPGCYSL